MSNKNADLGAYLDLAEELEEQIGQLDECIANIYCLFEEGSRKNVDLENYSLRLLPLRDRIDDIWNSSFK